VFQLASGVETSVNDLLGRLAEISGTEPAVRREPPRPGEILRNYSLIDKARARLGYSPQVKLEDGLQQTYEWFSSLNVAASN
jgi:nucleoside-diphosphate-sugar epimerase